MGILTAFVDPKDGQFKREILFFSSEKARDQSEKLCKALEESKALELKEIQIDGLSTTNENGYWFKVYDQKVLKATRKQVAPAVKEACSKVDAPSS